MRREKSILNAFRFPESVHQRLAAASKSTGTTKIAILLAALDSYLTEAEKAVAEDGPGPR